MISCSWFEDTTTPEGYVKHCIRLMDKNGLYAEGEAWQAMKQQTLKKASQITTLEEAHKLVSEAVHIAGGKHSVLNPPVEERKNVSEVENVRTFGTPTAGYASANIPYLLSDGYTLALTIGQDVARTGEVFCDDPIAPDIETETPLEDAVNWIIMNY